MCSVPTWTAIPPASPIFNWTGTVESGRVYHPGEQFVLCYDYEPNPPDGYRVKIHRSVNDGPWILLVEGMDDGTGDCLPIDLLPADIGRHDYVVQLTVGETVLSGQTYIYVEVP